MAWRPPENVYVPPVRDEGAALRMAPAPVRTGRGQMYHIACRESRLTIRRLGIGADTPNHEPLHEDRVRAAVRRHREPGRHALDLDQALEKAVGAG